MRIFTLLISTFFFLSQALIAQLQPLCGNEIFSEIVGKNYPDLQSAYEATFENARKQRPQIASLADYKVNVVVHVVWKNPEENLADSIIENQIRILNEDFNRLNPDTADLRTDFQPYAGNAGIEFRLAHVNRIKTSQDFMVSLTDQNLLSKLKSGAAGGSDAWNTEQFLNIWVCKIQPISIFGIPLGQILGFAFPPNGLGHWPSNSGAPKASEDGVVIDFRVFGANNPNPIEVPGGGGNLVVKGRTPVHEVGHYFGLRHIWGDGGILGLPNDCAQSDGVGDTPFANAQSVFDCEKTRNTCTKAEPFYGMDMPDLVENYMDYSSESCMNMFTKGQVAIMRSVIEGPRHGLLEPTSVEQRNSIAENLSLSPNPARNEVNLRFTTAQPRWVNVKIFDLNGRLIKTVTEQEKVGSDFQKSIDCQEVVSGIYFIQIQSEFETATRKLEIFR